MLEITFCILFLFSIAGNVIQFIINKRAIDRVNYLEGIFKNMYAQLGEFAISCESLLNNEIYSNEPVVMNFVYKIKELNIFLKQVEDFYTFDLLLSELNVETDNGRKEG